MHPLDARIGYGRRGQQQLGVGVQRSGEDLVTGGELDDASEIHDRDAVALVPDHCQVVGDKQVGKTTLALKVLEQVEDLSLDGDVEGRHRFVCYDHAGVERQCACDRDALPLATGEGVRIAAHQSGV